MNRGMRLSLPILFLLFAVADASGQPQAQRPDEPRRAEREARQSGAAERRERQAEAAAERRRQAEQRRRAPAGPSRSPLGTADDLMRHSEQGRRARLREEEEARSQGEEGRRLATEAERARQAAAAREHAAARRAFIRNLPSTFDSLEAADRDVVQAQAADDVTRFLDPEERADHIASLRQEQVHLGNRIAARMAEAFASFPATPDGLRGMRAERDRQSAVLARIRPAEMVDTVRLLYNRTADEKVAVLWDALIARGDGRLSALSGADYGSFSQLLGSDFEERNLLLLHPMPSRIRPVYRRFQTSMQETVNRMVDRSTPALVAWIGAMPPSRAADAKIVDFAMRTFRQSIDPDRHPLLAQAAMAKRAAYNPEGYERPDIVMSLRRRHWSEVSATGLEDLSYFVTAFRAVEDRCPGLVSPGGRNAVLTYGLAASWEASQRLMRGEVSSPQEAQRAVMLGLGLVFARPNCRAGGASAGEGCTTPEQQQALIQAMITSDPAREDMRKLTLRGCTSPEVRSHIDASVDFASGNRRDADATRTIPDAWSALSQR